MLRYDLLSVLDSFKTGGHFSCLHVSHFFCDLRLPPILHTELEIAQASVPGLKSAISAPLFALLRVDRTCTHIRTDFATAVVVSDGLACLFV